MTGMAKSVLGQCGQTPIHITQTIGADWNSLNAPIASYGLNQEKTINAPQSFK